VNVKDEGTLSFSAMAAAKMDGEAKLKYVLELEFMHAVNAKDSRISIGPRSVFVMVMKEKEAGRRPVQSPRLVCFAARS
jgi:hypothetical protein